MSETTQPQKEPVVSFTVSEVNQILHALGKIPAEHSLNLILFIKQTADSQVQATPELNSEGGTQD